MVFGASPFGSIPFAGGLPLENPLPQKELNIDSSRWTGLATEVSAQDAQIIREKAVALQQAIIQSDADIQLRTDACKRVEAVILLLEAPNVPWQEIVGLLNHPSVTAFLAAISLIQFIVSFSS